MTEYRFDEDDLAWLRGLRKTLIALRSFQPVGSAHKYSQLARAIQDRIAKVEKTAVAEKTKAKASRPRFFETSATKD